MSSSFLKNSAYTLLDLITFKKGVARRINNMTIRFPARWSRYYESNYETDNYLFLRNQAKAGMQVIDIGAHIGLFSAACSQLAGPQGRIICFEPTPGTYSVLKETLNLNHCNNVTPLQAAVGGSEGTATFYVSKVEGCNSNSLVNNRQGEELSSYNVQLVTIDGIVSEYSLKPFLVKIDAEGAELDVLSGGTATFKSSRPFIILGLHPDAIAMKGDSLKQIWDLVKSCNYQVVYNDKEITEREFISQNDIFDVRLIPEI